MIPGAPIDPEFPAGASDPSGLSRKEFLRLMGASLALAGAGACTRQPPEKIVPYVRQPEGLTPGEAQYYATAMQHGEDAIGLLVKSHEGRPTKIEGNPRHSVSLGRTSVHAQASLLELYDPDRSQIVRHHGRPSTWEDFLAAVQLESAKWKANQGAGVRLLTGIVHEQSSIRRFLQQYPQAQWHVHDACFGESTRRQLYDLGQIELIVSLDSDFLGAAAGNPFDTARFTEGRQTGGAMKRLYVFESMPSLTGSMADHRIAMNPSEIQRTAVALYDAIARHGEGAPAELEPLVRELLVHAGKGLVLADEYQSDEVQWAAQEINRLLGNPVFDRRYLIQDIPEHTVSDLARDMWDGKVTALIVIGSNPVYSAPADVRFPELVPPAFTVHCGLHFDETAATCAWHIPQSHYLESWEVLRSIDSTISVVQPLIERLYPSKNLTEMISGLLGESASPYDQLRSIFKEWDRPGEKKRWREFLQNGTRGEPSYGYQETRRNFPRPVNTTSLHHGEGLDVVIRPDPHLLDGRFANNAWLQELPKPITRLTWGNAIHLSPRTAETHHLKHGDEVELKSGARTLVGPVWVLPGHAENCATIHLGGGRWRAGRVGNGVGYNAAALQTAASPWLCRGVQIRATGKKHVFATTQHQHDMAGQHPVRVMAKGAALTKSEEKLDSLYPDVKYTSPSWGMVIDLNTCTGCGTCTVACQAENNIPVVGRAEVLRGRAMHWIRVDHYIEGGEEPQFLHQPIPCMHCENAPCELVCPVAATVHDHQGLNVMVYNRCIGTRYCSNNCPYKVRRFNFFQYSDLKSPQLRLQRNPDVTVRERGVMEKCTYCIQRISAARITADVENRPIRDGEVVPACAQACPANAIAFGDIMDPSSKVSAARRDPRHYALLEELNTRPRTTYLARVTNPNPEMAK